MNTIRAIRRTLFCAVLATAPNLAGCGNVQITPGAQDEMECRELRGKLTDKTTTPVSAAEIKREMESAGCGSLLLGP